MLTDHKVRAAKPRPKSFKLADTGRMFLLVTPSGGKLWRWNYTFDGKNKTMAFGAWPQVSLADARVKRDEAFAILSEHRDPVVAKKLRKAEAIEASRQTFEKVARNGSPTANPNGRSSTRTT